MKNAVHLKQKRLVSRLLNHKNILECKLMSDSMNFGAEIRKNDVKMLLEKGASTCRSIVGSLLFTAIKSHLDLCVATSSHGSHVGRPCDQHMIAAKRVFQHLKRKLERWMKLELNVESQLRAYVDSNRGSTSKKNGKSHIRVIIQYGHDCVNAVSKLRKTISLISTKVEFTALTKGCLTFSWLKKVTKKINIHQDATITDQENSCAVEQTEGGPRGLVAKRKRVDIKLNNVMKLTRNEEIKLNKACGGEIVAENLTMLLPSKKIARINSRATTV